MAIEEKKFLGTAAVERLIANTRQEIAAGDQATLEAAKQHAIDLGVNYDPAGTAQTKVNELANGAVKANTDAIAKLNGSATEDGSVAKAVADVKAEIDKDIDDLSGRMGTAESNIGDVDTLETTAKNLASAINEIRNAVSAGGVSAAVTMETTTTTEGMAKSYTLKQGDNVVGTIDIPKDMVVESGEVVTNPEGQPEGTYIKLVLANAANDVIYVNVGTLVDIYKAQASASQIQLAIDSASREISATIVAGSVTATELAADAVVTAKIADGNVTKAKLSSAVQTSLDKADAAAPQTALDEEIERAKAAEKANTDAIDGIKNGLMSNSFLDIEKNIAQLTSAIEEVVSDLSEDIADAESNAVDTARDDATSKANAAEAAAKSHADDLNTAMNARVEALEAIDHEHDNKGVIDGITAEKVSAWDAAEQNAKDYADDLDEAMDARVKVVEDKAHEHANKDVIDGITAEKVAAWDAAEGNAKAHADDLNTAMDNRMKVVEEKAHIHENAAELNKIADGDVAKWNAAQANAEATAAADATAKANQALADAKAYADTAEADANTYTDQKVAAIDLSGIETNASDIDKLEASLAEGGATANAIADAKKAGTDAADAVSALEEGKVADLRTDVDALKAVSYVEITADEIDAMFETA